MTHDESDASRTQPEPYWVTVTLQFVPNPLVLFTVVCTLFVAAFGCATFAVVDGWPGGYVWSALTFVLALALSTAFIVRRIYIGRWHENPNRHDDTPRVPTLAIFSLLLAIASGGISLLTHLPLNFPGALRLNGVKYAVTLVLTILASLYWIWIGRREVTSHYAALNGPVVLSPLQVFGVVIYLAILVAYAIWVIP